MPTEQDQICSNQANGSQPSIKSMTLKITAAFTIYDCIILDNIDIKSA